MNWDMTYAKNGQPTIEIKSNEQSYFIHSRYNPEKEAEGWVEKIELNDTVEQIYIIGMGLGYHIRALQSKFPNIEIEVWDFNTYYKKWIELNGFVSDLIDNGINYKSSEELLEINEKLLKKLNDKTTDLIIHKPSLNLMSPTLDYLRNKLEDINFIKQSYLEKKDLLKTNFENNVALCDDGINTIIKKNNNKPFLLVSAGPSLTKQLPLIKMLQNSTETIIGCVGTAVKPLIKEGVKPNFIMISDPQDNLLTQIEGVETNDLTLFYLSTANHKTVSAFKGKRYVVWQKGYFFSEEAANMRIEPLIKTGGSVATCLLDLMVTMGSCIVALVGQDLAFTNGKSHAESTSGYRNINQSTIRYEVDNYYLTGSVPTSKNLSIYLKWFEQYSSTNRSLKLWNCTEGGAHIKGWSHQPLNTFYKYIKY